MSPMKNKLHRFGFFTGLLAAALIAAGCQSSKTACCKMSASDPTVMQIHDTKASPGSSRRRLERNQSVPVQTKASQSAMTPQSALAELRDGNARFVAGRPLLRNLPAQVTATASGQYPFAVVLSCLDSRQPIEIVLDQGIGDIFSARVAGNVLDDDILGSMEFACKVSGRETHRRDRPFQLRRHQGRGGRCGTWQPHRVACKN